MGDVVLIVSALLAFLLGWFVIELVDGFFRTNWRRT